MCDEKKEEEQQQNWNFHVRFSQLWEGLMEFRGYIYIRIAEGFCL